MVPLGPKGTLVLREYKVKRVIPEHKEFRVYKVSKEKKEIQAHRESRVKKVIPVLLERKVFRVKKETKEIPELRESKVRKGKPGLLEQQVQSVPQVWTVQMVTLGPKGILAHREFKVQQVLRVILEHKESKVTKERLAQPVKKEIPELRESKARKGKPVPLEQLVQSVPQV
jgi:uncharacterized protein YbaR (Trm112 family)